MQIHFEPLETFPRRSTVNRKSGAKFQTQYGQTLIDLRYELGKLKARDIVIQIGLERRDIRNDGLPRSDARKPSHPGIVLSFTCPAGNLRFMCDEYADWKANLRALAKYLERLRLLDIDGVARDYEQYRGFQALPPAPDPTERPDAATMRAAQLLSQTAQLEGVSSITILHSAEAFQRAYRQAAQKCHPDAGGDVGQMIEVNSAAEILKRRFGL
jgi:hypothetical protein